MAKSETRPITLVIATALERYERERMITEYHASLKRLYADPEAAAEYEAEMRDWEDASLSDLHASIGDDW